LVGFSELTLIENNRNIKIPVSIDQGSNKDWIEINFGDICSLIKLKRLGDDNAMTSQAHLISWERNDFLEKRTTTILNIKELMKNQRTN